MEKGTPYNLQYEDKADRLKAESATLRPPGLHHTPPASPGWSVPAEPDVAPLRKALGARVPPFIAEAIAIIDGSRQQDYGGPEDSFQIIADFWTIYNRAKGKLAEGKEIEAEDVAAMMRLMKEARLAGNPTHRDSFVDTVGYLAIEARMRGIDE